MLGGMGGWLSAFWASNSLYDVNTHYKHEYSVLNPQFGQKKVIVSFGKTHYSIVRV